MSEKSNRRNAFNEKRLRLFFLALGVVSIVFALNLLFFVYAVWFSTGSETTVEGILSKLQGLVIAQCVTSGIAALILSTWFTKQTNKTLGPVYRFEQLFKQLEIGRWDVECRLRKGDERGGLRDAINAALGTLTARMRCQQEALTRADEAFAHLEAGTLDSEAVRAAREAIEAERVEFDRRFGVEESAEEKELVMAGDGELRPDDPDPIWAPSKTFNKRQNRS